MDTTKTLAVQSWAMRHFKQNSDLIAKIKELGLSRVELCGVHCDFNKPETFDGIVKTFADAGVKIVSIGVEGMGVDETAIRNRFEFARKAGCKVISCTFSPALLMASLPIVYKMCAEFNINLAIHNHGGYDWLGNQGILDWVLSITRPCIGLNIDTAWALDAKANPVEWAKRFAGRIYATHLKDFTFDRARNSTDVVVGTGNLDLPGYLAALKAGNFNGEMILEYEGDIENPLPALKQCVQAITKAG